MAGIFMAKRATTTINRASIIKDHGLPGPFFFSTAYERAQESNAVSESTRATRDPAEQGMNEAAARQQTSDTDISQLAKESVRKATEVADATGDTAKKTLDGAWQTAKDASQMVRDTVTGNGSGNGNVIDEDGIIDNQFVDEMQKIDGPVDTVDYRNMEDNFEEMKKTGGEAN